MVIGTCSTVRSHNKNKLRKVRKMKKLLALFLGVLMAMSCFGVAALKLDTAEAELFTVTDDDELMYSPADKYGNLVGSISFDNGNGNTDGASFAPYLVSTSAFFGNH